MQTDNQTPDDFDIFISQILREKGITDLEPTIYEGVARDLKESLLGQIDRAAISRLTEDQAAALAEKLEDPSFSSTDTAQYIQACGIDLAAVSLDTMLKFRQFYLGAGA